MSSNRDTGSSQQSSSQTSYTPTPEERELQALQLSQAKEFDPIQRELNKRGGNLINQLLIGDKNLPGFLSRLPQGISPEVTQDLVNQSLGDINAQLAASGAGTFIDSGAAQTIGARTAADIRRASEEFNLGNLFNLLNLGVGGQAQVQQPVLATTQMLSNRLAGLRGVSTTGTTSGTSRQTFNPFLESFYGSAGSGLGNIFNPQSWYKPGGCWVAAELFGGWNKLKTRFARIWIQLKAPSWLRSIYMKHGEAFAKIIRNNELAKSMILPLFERFAVWGGYDAR